MNSAVDPLSYDLDGVRDRALRERGGVVEDRKSVV